MKSFIRIWRFFKTYRTRLIIMMVLGGLMSVLMSAAVPIFGYLIDSVFAQSSGVSKDKLAFIDRFYAMTFGNNRETLVWAIPATLVILYFFGGFVRYGHIFLMRYIGDQVAHDIRKALQSKYLRLNQKFHGTYGGGSGGLLSRTMSDVLTVQNSTGLFAEMVREPIMAAIMIVYMVYIDPQLTAVLLLVTPIIALVIKQLARSLRKYGHQHQENMEVITSNMKETLDGIKIIQSYNLENKMEQIFDERTSRFLPVRRKILGREEFAGPVTEFIGALVVGGLILYFAKEATDTVPASPAVFMSFILALGMLQKPIKKIQNAFILIQQAIVSLDRILEILEAPDEVPQIEKAKPFPKKWESIDFKDVSFTYGENKALDNINLSVKRGEVIALVGASGSGKSTLINILERFFDASEGSVTLDDSDIRHFDLKDWRKNIALVTQDVFLFNDTVGTNISYGDLEKDPNGVSDASKAANADGFIGKLSEGYDSMVGERGSFFSGGEKQRISIARAIYKDAPILVLDEATSALDSVSEIEVQKGLEQLMKGRTAFVIAHRLSTIKKADRIIVMAHGRIVEQGTHEELIASKQDYYQYFKHQSEN